MLSIVNISNVSSIFIFVALILVTSLTAGQLDDSSFDSAKHSSIKKDNNLNNSDYLQHLLVENPSFYKQRNEQTDKISAYTPVLNNTTTLCALQPGGMAAWYKGEGNVSDSTGGNPGAGFFNGTFPAGKVGQAMNFNGTNNYAALATRQIFEGKITLAAWIKPTTITGSQTIISRYDASDVNGIHFYFSINSGKLYFQVNQTNSVSRSYITANSVINAGVYQHVAAAFNPSTQLMEIFVNGESVPLTLVNSGTVTSLSFQNLNPTPVKLGALTEDGIQNTQYFGGQIDEAQMFYRVLSSSEIQSIYNAGSTGVCNKFNVSGRITTAGGRPLYVPIGTLDGLETIYSFGGYNVKLDQDHNHIITPKFSTHSFSPSSYSFNPLTDEQSGKDFTATFINNNFTNAVQLTGEFGEIEGSNEDATREAEEPFHAGMPGATSVWYRWRAPRNGTFTFSLEGSRFDTLLAVYRGTSVGNLSLVAANDNLPTATFSRVTFAATANTDYWIAVDGRAGASGAGFFKMIYHPADHIPGFTVSGLVTIDSRPVTIKAENLNGDIIALSILKSRYSIVIPQGVNSFKLTVSGRAEFDPEIFSNITQNQTYNFLIRNCCDGDGSMLQNVGGLLTLFGLNSTNDLSVTVSGTNIAGLLQCDIFILGSGVRYLCPGLLPYGTYTITPSHPVHTFSPASRTFVNLSSNIEGASFTTNNASGITISGKVTQGDTLLNGVGVSILSTFSTETDANGNYSIGPLPAGARYEVSVSLPGFNFQPPLISFTNLQSNQTVNFSGTSSCSYNVSPLQQNVSSAGGFQSFNITANTGCPWQARANSAGITVISPLSYASGTVSYFVEPNTGAARTGIIKIAGQTVTINQAAGRVLYDFDGDGKADISVYRPDNGVWYLLQSNAGFTGVQFGISTDRIVPADYDGDGRTDLAVYRDGIWYLQRSTAGFTGVGFGQTGDIPQPADFDGDGKAEIAVFRPSNGVWYVLNLANNQFTAAQFGADADKPVVGDYDGDSKADYAVFRPSNGVWYLLRSRDGFIGIQFGAEADKPTPADYDGDGRTDLAVFRPSNSVWYLQQSQAGFTGIQFGITTDLPTPADYDGDGRADIAVYRPANGVWYVQQTRAGFLGVGFGISADKPVPNAFVP